MYGPPLHMGKISSSDFNYPNDFHLFNTPGRKQELLMQAGFYMLASTFSGESFKFGHLHLNINTFFVGRTLDWSPHCLRRSRGRSCGPTFRHAGYVHQSHPFRGCFQASLDGQRSDLIQSSRTSRLVSG